MRQSFLKFCLTIFMVITTVGVQYAQVYPTEPDSIGNKALNRAVHASAIQSDGKVILAGDFWHFKRKFVGRIIRLNVNGTIDTTFVPGIGANNIIKSISIQTDGKIIIGGQFTSYAGVARYYIARLNADGTLDYSFNIGTGCNNYVLTTTLQTDGKVIIGGYFTSYNGTLINRIARLNSDGSLDLTYNVGTGLNGDVFSAALQTNGKIVVGGNFTTFNGTTRNRIARINADGSLDGTFDPLTGPSSNPMSISIQSDSKIIIGGLFANYQGSSRWGIARINSDGSLDFGFNVGTGAGGGSVEATLIQPDGKVIIGGWFTTYNGTLKNRIARLNTDGSLDGSFNAPLDAQVYTLALQANGKIILGGEFTTCNGTSKNFAARVDATGVVDIPFNLGNGSNGTINTVVVQPDGKILIGGNFSSYNDEPRQGLVRINKDGKIDNTFVTGTGASNVNAIVLQPDGKIVIGGGMFTYNSTAVYYLTRLNPDGTIDPSFNIGTGASGPVQTIAIQNDGKFIVGGFFNMFNGVSQNFLVRLNANGSVDPTFNVGVGTNAPVICAAIQSDGKILLGGYFTQYNGVTKNYFTRVNSNGSLDATFTSGVGTNAPVKDILLDKNENILIGGFFTLYNGVGRNYLARLHTSGSLDASFNNGAGPDNYVNKIAIQQDERIIIGGQFTTFDGTATSCFARLYASGSLDMNLIEPFGMVKYSGTALVNAIAIQPNGKIIFGGSFDSYYYLSLFNNIVRINGTPIYYNTIKGVVYDDADKNCLKSISEKPLASMLIQAMPGPFYSNSDKFGKYELDVDSGSVTYTVQQKFNPIQSKLYTAKCQPTHTVALSGAAKDTCCYDFADSVKQCALLHVSIQSNRMRRCLRNTTYVNYCNYGNLASTSAQVVVEYPDYLEPLSSSPMWTSKNGKTLTYTLGSIGFNECGKISIVDSVVCGNESIRGLTQCIHASISPASTCITQNPLWDKSSMKVTGSCVNDSARFVIQNAGSGNMTGSHEYRVYVNDTLVFKSTFSLKSGEQLIIKYPAEGNTIRVEADQHLLHPGKSRPRATVEGCGVANPNTGKLNLVTTAPVDDANEETAVTCLPILDSYDPNDKQTMPKGIGLTNQVIPGEELEYVVRFQNTGTDTAYVVKIVDTIDANVDVGSFVEGASSHPYTLAITGKGQAVLTFTFANINLPDSTTDKLGSNGLVSFRITIPASASIGTVVKNKAYIYFDYNSPILTNETMHTVGSTVPEDLSKGSKVSVVSVSTGTINKASPNPVKLFPNPSQGSMVLEMQEYNSQATLRLYSMLGVKQKEIALLNVARQEVDLTMLAEGVYLYELWQKGGLKANGLLQIRK